MIYIIVLAILVLLLLIPLKLDISFRWNEYGKKLKIKLKFAFFQKSLNNKKEKNNDEVLEENKQKDKKKHSFSEVISTFKEIKRFYKEDKVKIDGVFNYLKNHIIKISRFDFKLDFDTQNPMKTGILVGATNGITYNVVNFLSRYFNFGDWNVNIKPLFQNRDTFSLEFGCIISAQGVHIIIVIIRIIPLIIKFKKILKK